MVLSCLFLYFLRARRDLWPLSRFKLNEGNAARDRTSYGAFASWFIRDNIELNGRLMFDDMDDFAGSDSYGDAAQLGVTIRF